MDDDGNCLACGQTHSRGLHLHFCAGALGQVHARFRLERTPTGYGNVVHVDGLLGVPLALQTERMAVTER